MTTKKSIDIFPWNENFNTNISEIDEQHKRLVDLLNQLASHVAFKADIPGLNVIFDQLTDYTVYHFQTEEAIWYRYLADSPLDTAHAVKHQQLIDEVLQLKVQINAKPSDELIGDILAFLARWLITHILESDRYLAMVVCAIQSGLPLEEAKEQAAKNMAGATQKLISLILSVYESLSINTLHLMREISEQKRLSALLAQQKESHKALMAVLPVGVFESDKDCLCTYVNPRWSEITGVAAETAIGTHWKKSIHPDDLSKVHQTWLATIPQNQPFSLEYRFLQANGSVIWVLNLLTPFKTDAGEERFIGTLTDISQIKATEQALRQTTAALQRAQQVGHIGNWSYQVTDGDIECSEQLYTIFGRQKTAEKITYALLLSWLHPDDRVMHDAYLQKMLALSPATQAKIKPLKYRLRRPNGDERWVEAKFECEFSETGQLTRFFSTVQDITEHKLAEAHIIAHDQQLQFIIDHSPVYIAYCDADLRYKWVNQAYAELFDIQPKVLIGKSIQTVMCKEVLTRNSPYIQQVLSGNSVEYDLSFPDNSTQKYFWVRYTPEFNQDHQVVGFVAAISDITKRKQLERFEHFRSTILELMTQDTPTTVILEKIVTGIESLNPEILCGILLVDQSGSHLGEGVSPSLPDFYNQAVDQIEIGMGVGSCGTAAFTGKRVIVSDISSHPYWVSFKDLANQAGLSACWSQPIYAAAGKVLGTFAIYHRQVHTPIEEEISLIEKTAYLVSLAIEHNLADERLRDSENRMRILFEQAPLAYQSLDIEANILEVNALWLSQMGYTLDEVIGRFIGDFIADESMETLQGEFPQFKAKNKVDGPTFTMIRKDGSRFLWQVNGRISRDEQGRFVRTHCLLTDITERQQIDAKLQLAASVFSHAREGIVITDPEGTILEVNDTFTNITGYSRDEMTGQNPKMLKSGRQSAEFYKAMWCDIKSLGYWSGEIWNRRKSGEVYAELLTISAVRDAKNRVKNYVALFSDISHIKAHQQQLEHIAHYDILTNLPNRVLLADRMDQAMAQCLRHQQILAVVFLDLDGFKEVNDQHGHDVGDQLLITVSHAMQAALRDGDTLARLGGDEFIAVIVSLEKVKDCEPVLQRLLQAASALVTIDDIELHVSASVGVTIYPQDLVDADQLIRHADQAMYIAKQRGKNRYHLFDTVQDNAMKTHLAHIQQIYTALHKQQFVLYYQPKANLKTKKIIGVEALIRWQHPERGLVPPGEFLPWIEDHAISIELGEWVISTALKQIATWQTMGLALPISVNIGAYQLQHSNFVTRLSALLADFPDIDPHSLELEVLETSALNDISHISTVMHACCALGVRFSLDDFGTGYSSLTYLRRLPATQIKIDQTFVRDMLDDPDDHAIVEGVIGLARAFQREVIAEGVETLKHGDALLALGCELVQGYGIARPMPAENIPDWINDWQQKDA